MWLLKEDNLKAPYQKVTYEDGGVYKGIYENEMRTVKGVYIFPNKDIYMGNWRKDRFHGDGVYIYSNGDKFRGKFE